MCRKNLDKIENLMDLHPRGLNIREIAQKISVSRLTAARYLDVLTAEGRLELRVVGKSKMYYRPVNISDVPCYQFAETGTAACRNIYRALIEQIGEMLITFDHDGIITKNRQIRPLTGGYDDDELRDRHIHDFLVMDPDGMSLLSTLSPESTRNQKPVSCRFRIKDGAIRKHNAIISSSDDGRTVQYYCVLWNAHE